MTLIDDILKYNSIAVVGIKKNTGKTECLNFILSKLKNTPTSIAVTSIGIDGESTDQIYLTQKPEITLYPGMTFVTTEKHYRQRKITSSILDILDYGTTSLGRLVVAKAVNTGKVLLSGPPDTGNLKRLINDLKNTFSSDITLVDGALSRLSLSAPAITDAMILATGAAISANIPQLIRKTKYVFDLINLPQIDNSYKLLIHDKYSGIWSFDKDGCIHDLNIKSVFLLNSSDTDIFRYGNTIFVTGAIGDSFVEKLKTQKNIHQTLLIVRDYTKIFVSPDVMYSFLKKGGQLQVVDKPNLIAITINPLSPSGYLLNSDVLREEMKKVISAPIFDVKKL